MDGPLILRSPPSIQLGTEGVAIANGCGLDFWGRERSIVAMLRLNVFGSIYQNSDDGTL